MAEEGKSKYNVGDKKLWNEREDNEIQSIYSHKGEEGIELDYDMLEPFLSQNLINELGADLKDYSVLLSEDVAMRASESKEFR